MQKFHYSVSLINIVTVLNSLLVAAWTDKEELRKESNRLMNRENDLLRRMAIEGQKDT